MKRIVIIGATSSIATHCARLWVKNAAIDLTLVGRDASRLERVAADLRARSPQSSIRAVEARFFDPAAIADTVADITRMGAVDIALIAHGSLPDQAECQRDLQACHEALGVNAISPVLFAEAFAGKMAEANHGTLALIGSVAGDRGRRSNYVYGAAKGLVTRYAQGLQHRLAITPVKVVLVKPGPTATPMTANLGDKAPKLAPVETVARQIVDGIAKGQSVIYTPAKWRLIMQVVRHLPAFVFNRMDV